MSFEILPSVLGEALAERGYENPTSVQAAVIAPEAVGRDLIVSAQTGSGKTVAFGIALAEQLLGSLGEGTGGGARAETPRVLIIAPTRELALQVSRELGWLYGKAGVRIASLGTPGRLRDHIERGALDLSALVGLVLDEADEMLDMGFRDDLEEILDATPETRRTLMFSATMPRAIKRLAERYQSNALQLQLKGQDRGHSDIPRVCRDRCCRARYRFADAELGHPCRNAARCGDFTTPLGPDWPRR